ncbi:hypothetical protein RD1_3685 [Roseobacter denitrificans OCh 114]|uniref:Uncharacterized protein n=1 Tax=Roseobacter denitrificans (strain ATCC 33942 / OCh 114) TaxID=375451 RepID=Q162D5_ROSDO|nr:hypothetical protein RD1_3685 [Roseobacter denitrificans OCh 114]
MAHLMFAVLRGTDLRIAHRFLPLIKGRGREHVMHGSSVMRKT